MIITCPACESRYVVEPDKMGREKRKVRCANCKHVWDVENTEKDLEPSIEPPKWRRIPPAIPEPSQTSVWPWFLFFVVVLTFAISIILGRHTIMDQWPQTNSFYAKLGFHTPVPGEGLHIEEVKAFHAHPEPDQPKKLTVRGKVINISNEVKVVPPLRITIEGKCPKDSEKTCALQTWQHKLAHTRLLPKETVEFESETLVTAINPEKVVIGF